MAETSKLNTQIYTTLTTRESDAFRILGPKVLIVDEPSLLLLTQIVT